MVVRDCVHVLTQERIHSLLARRATAKCLACDNDIASILHSLPKLWVRELETVLTQFLVGPCRDEDLCRSQLFHVSDGL